jgi:hypothetical protein
MAGLYDGSRIGHMVTSSCKGIWAFDFEDGHIRSGKFEFQSQSTDSFLHCTPWAFSVSKLSSSVGGWKLRFHELIVNIGFYLRFL